ncbi:MAG: hypothetical protein WC307_02995 [Candidatus Nanoarchaeia archaeon]|jgi:hypothetical protein
MISLPEERELNKQKCRLGLFSDLIILKNDNYSGSINTKNWDITISLSDSLSMADKPISHYYKNKRLEGSLDFIIARDILFHEASHWKECPNDLTEHYELLSRAASSLSAYGIKSEKTIGYVTNMFEDIIVNYFVRENYSNHAGQVLFFYDQCTDGGLTGLYESYMKVSLSLWGDKRDKRLVRQFYHNESKVNAIASELKSLFSKEEFLKKETWDQLINGFIKAIHPLLSDDETVKQPSLFGTKFFDEKINSPQGARELITVDYRVNNKVNNDLINKFGLETYFDNFYKLMADNVEVSCKKEKSLQFNLSVGHRPYRIGDSVSRAELSRVAFSTELNCFVPSVNRGSIEIKLPLNLEVNKLEDLDLIIDASGSMGQPGDMKSSYHYALMGFYGVINYLESINQLNNMRFNVCLFSDTTITSGFRYYSELDDVKKVLFNPESGSTYLDLDVVNNSISDSTNCSVIMLSDGGIFNWDKIKFDFMKLMNNHSFSFIGINYSSNASNDLKQNGFSTYQINNKSDLSSLIIDLTKKSFKERLG